MKKQFCVGLLAVSLLDPANLVLACGAKFISAVRGTRFEQAPKGHQEAVLIYTNPTSDVPAALSQLSADDTLRRAGYRPKTITQPEEFERELRDGKWDLVVAGVADAQQARTHTRQNLRVLLVALKMANPELKQARKQYSVVLTKPPASHDELVRRVGTALSL